MLKERPVEPTREQAYQRRIAELEAQLRQRDERIAALERQVAQLAQKIGKRTVKPVG
jgi:phage shock protein A